MFNFDTDNIVDISLEDKVRIHLSTNFYPAITDTMVQPCIDAIHHVMTDQEDAAVSLNGNTWRGQDAAPAGIIFDAHRLWDVL